MAKTKDQKKELIEKYSDLIAESKGMVLVKSKSLTPNEVNDFRKALSEFDSRFHVIKNTLFKIALTNNKLEDDESLNTGEHTVMFFGEDLVNPSKKLKEFIDGAKISKDQYKMNIVAGYLDGEKLSGSQVKDLADMPNKEQSIALILGVLDQAMSGVVNVLEDAPRSIATIIDQAFEEESK